MGNTIALCKNYAYCDGCGKDHICCNYRGSDARVRFKLETIVGGNRNFEKRDIMIWTKDKNHILFFLVRLPMHHLLPNMNEMGLHNFFSHPREQR